MIISNKLQVYFSEFHILIIDLCITDQLITLLKIKHATNYINIEKLILE
jgi:hypothetical protein